MERSVNGVIIPTYVIDFDRGKRRTARERVQNPGQYVTGNIEVKCLDDYIATRIKTIPNGSFWRYLIVDKKNDGILNMTERNIGKHTLRMFGEDIAKALHLPYPENYTGHCWRSTSINLLSDNGRTVNQIKQLTGKKYVYFYFTSNKYCYI